MSSLLDSAALIEVLPTLLPPAAEGGEAQARLTNGADGLVALLHTVLIRLDFKLLGLSSVASPPPSTNVLPARWNAGDGAYALTYSHPQSSLRFLVRCAVLGPRLSITATALEGQARSASLEVELDRFTSPSYFSSSSGSAAQATEPLINGFVSSSRVQDFVLELKRHVISKLVPGLHKEGYQEEFSSSADSSGSRAPQRADPEQGARPRPQPDDPRYPGATDGPSFPPPRNPLAVGDRDLNPLALPGRGGARFGPPPLFGNDPDDGGGMMVGPNHPMFRDRFGPQRGGEGEGGNPFAGPVPPGARFDPVGPGMGPFGGAPGGFPGPGGPRRPRGGPGGDPDWDDVRPPGNGNFDMFM